MNYKRLLRRAGRYAWRVATMVIAATILLVVLYRWMLVPLTPLMVIRCVEQKTGGRPVRLEKDWVPLKDISPYLQAAAVAAEDQRFLAHHGFDFEMISQAIEYNQNTKRKRGASTISQQTVKNVFLWPGRSWLRKGLEVYFTILVEFFWSKRRIMEVYLNVVETGPGVYGAEATARHFWGKHARELAPEEAALITAILPRPLRWSIAQPGPYVLARQESLAVRIPDFMYVLAYQPYKNSKTAARHPAHRAETTQGAALPAGTDPGSNDSVAVAGAARPDSGAIDEEEGN